MKKYRIVIVDDHPIVLQGIKQTLAESPDFKLVAAINDGNNVIRKIAELAPDILLLDISMPNLDGFAIAATLQKEKPAIKIIFLTVFREESYLQKALRVGAQGYILKDSSPNEILTGIKTVSEGYSFVSPAMTMHLVRNAAAPKHAPGIEVLTSTERTILKLIAQYKTTKEIALAVFVSPRTIETHRNNMCHKLHLRGSHALMKFATAHLNEL